MKYILIIFSLFSNCLFASGVGSILRPGMSQENIEKAIEHFKIKIPSNVKKIYLNLDLNERGMTYLKSFMGYYTVAIGPSAFSSWAILGSTIAHEVEVHCNQSLSLYAVFNYVGFDKIIKSAEYDAYSYEIDNAYRFGLKDSEIEEIEKVRDYYYGI